jgi:hypothetical protein
MWGSNLKGTSRGELNTLNLTFSHVPLMHSSSSTRMQTLSKRKSIHGLEEGFGTKVAEFVVC